jgi:hypothetical protein
VFRPTFFAQQLEHAVIQCHCLDQAGSLDDNIQRVLQLRRKSLRCQCMLVKNAVTRDHTWIHIFDESCEPEFFPKLPEQQQYKLLLQGPMKG